MHCVRVVGVVGGAVGRGERAGVGDDDDDEGVGHEEPKGGVLEESGGGDVVERDVEKGQGYNQD